MHTITWTCVLCGAKNEWEMHSDPDAHFFSMICDGCGDELDGCFCQSDENTIRRAMSALGKRSAEKQKGIKDFHAMAKKRWQK